ncbi:MAG: alpha/beta fold hydrolase, partial [Solirubrobacteraceae bacterium]
MSVDEHTINLEESPVFYRTAEASAVPVLYLHGIPTSSDDWVEFLARTGGIAPDLIGFGRSGKGGHLDYSLAGLTGFLERFLAELQIDAVKLVAHDWGAAVGLTLAHRHPQRVERLVLLNAPPLFDGFAWPRLVK